MALDDERLDRLISLIKDSFRVRENQDPIYVDVGGHLGRVAAPQHQVIFGRRGSGKSCLLVHYNRRVAPNNATLSVYIVADEVKRLSYPDLLIRLLLSILRKFPRQKRRFWDWVRRRESPLAGQERALEGLLEKGEVSKVVQETSRRRRAAVGGSGERAGVPVKGEFGREESEAQIEEFTQAKLEYLERHLQDFKDAIKAALAASKYQRAAIIVDDFYLIHPTVQPDVVDYLHRLLRGTDLYLKIATVRHRTKLARYEGRLIGVELVQDVEAINLDQTFQDLPATQSYLAQMIDSMGEHVGIESVSDEFISPDGLFALTFASGGVPRDYFTIFDEAVRAALAAGRVERVTPRYVYRGAARVSYQTKLTNLRSDVGPDAEALERVLSDLVTFTLTEKRKTAFLIAQDEAQRLEQEHELIQQLMDFKLIHVVVPDTSAASGRPGRYEAYTMDAASFMEPRRRGIELVEFWRIDEQSRPRGIREAPVYPLARVRAAVSRPTSQSTEDLLAAIQPDGNSDSAGETPPEEDE
jgi:hypothetical protein